jgi:tetratricopeptide (TPR) repeat protein
MGYPELCLGRTAERPYYFNKMLVNVYSVEELCYCIRNEAYLIDSDIVDSKLADWVDRECGLPDLGADLARLVREKGSAAAFAGVILEYTGYQTREEIAETEEIVRKNAGMSGAERGKTKADYLYDSGRYSMALDEYERLIGTLPEGEVTMRADLLYNIAAAQAQLFNFSGAAENYRQSYECTGNEDTLRAYLAAVRLSMKNEDYVEFLAAHTEYCDASLETESIIRKWYDQFDTTQQSRMLFTLKVLREDGSDISGDPAPYYSEVDQLTSGLKKSYREMVQADGAVQRSEEQVEKESQ